MKKFSSYLKREGIENQLDISTSTDWGDDQYGDKTASLWIIDEDQSFKASRYLEEFLANPTDSKYQEANETVIKVEAIKPSISHKKERSVKEHYENNVITFIIIFICTLYSSFLRLQLRSHPREAILCRKAFSTPLQSQKSCSSTTRILSKL